jgi:hypothetical protein
VSGLCGGARVWCEMMISKMTRLKSIHVMDKTRHLSDTPKTTRVCIGACARLF